MAAPASVAETVRRFNRFYTARIGALGGRFLDTPHSLTEARVLYELGTRGRCSGAALAEALEADPAQVSRAVTRLLRQRLVSRTRDPRDRRVQPLTLTARGRREYARLDARSAERATALVARLSASDRSRLQAALRTVESLLDSGTAPAPQVAVRLHRPGDLGWIVSRHGALYVEEHGWDGSFEAFVAGVAKEFLDRFDPDREACWIAEVDGRPVGSVCLVRQSDEVAKLRLLIVEPSARGLGIGRRLVTQCVEFARRVGYRTITLWTNDTLDAARHIYEAAGFARVEVSQPRRMFGKDQVFETWELALGEGT